MVRDGFNLLFVTPDMRIIAPFTELYDFKCLC